MSNLTKRRGIQNFRNIIESESLTHKTNLAQKGRSQILNLSRNNLLLTRYWFYVCFTQNRFDIILKILSYEFKLSERRITDIIQEDKVIVETLKAKRPSLKQLNLIYPFMIWKKGANYNADEASKLEYKIFKTE